MNLLISLKNINNKSISFKKDDYKSITLILIVGL